MAIPSRITAGDTVEFSLPEDDYTPADGWVMYVQFVNADHRVVVEGVPVAGSSDFVISAAQTSAMPAGSYRATAYVERGTGVTLERHSIQSLMIEVVSGLLDSATDVRGHAAKMLDALEAVLEKRATTDVLKYEIRGRALERMPVEDLIRWRNYYRIELKKELAAASGKSYGLNKYRMTFR